MQRFTGRAMALGLSVGLMLAAFSSTALAQYKLAKLTSNLSGQAKNTDSLLVNGWGLVYAPGGPFWVSDNGTGWSTLYDGMGTPQALQVVVPAFNGTSGGTPTGIVFNGSQEFNVQGWPAIFLFATLDGTISGWAPQSNPTQAIVAVNNWSSGAVYTGLAITSNSSGNFLFAADTANNKVDIYDGSFNLVTSFTDTTVPAGFTPFGISDISGQVYVSFADSTGGPGGYIDIFTEAGVFVKRLAQGKPLNQPWGFAVAPKNFGSLSGALLIGNNVNFASTINGFSLKNGQFVGTIKNSAGKPIVIDQLWGIDFGGGAGPSVNGNKNQLFFAAGPANNVNGLFGFIEPSGGDGDRDKDQDGDR
jgi:uncharacterized protein (TIGR03118 family)